MSRSMRWQIHVQSVRPAGSVLRNAPQPRPPHLPQFLPSGRALAVQRHPPGQGARMIDTIPQLPRADVFKVAARQFRADVLRGLRAPTKELPCKYFYDEVG